jgi:hypothetical protein
MPRFGNFKLEVKYLSEQKLIPVISLFGLSVFHLVLLSLEIPTTDEDWSQLNLNLGQKVRANPIQSPRPVTRLLLLPRLQVRFYF